jgi:hypothetical protein
MWEGVVWLGAEHAKACFVLPQWEVIAHFAHWDLRPAKAEVGSSAYVNAHSSIDVCTNLQVGFLPFPGEQGGLIFQ